MPVFEGELVKRYGPSSLALIVINKEHSFAEQVGVRHQNVENLRDVPRSVVDWPVRMFGIAGGCGDPGDLRQLTAFHIVRKSSNWWSAQVVPVLFGCSTGRDDA